MQPVGALERRLELEAVAERPLLRLREEQADGADDQPDQAGGQVRGPALLDAPHGIFAPVCGSAAKVSPGGTRAGPSPTPLPPTIWSKFGPWLPGVRGTDGEITCLKRSVISLDAYGLVSSGRK